MRANKIIFATDFSHLSDEALQYAATLAKEADATLLIAHVEELPAIYGEGAMYYGVPEPDRKALEKMLVGVVPHDPEIRFEHRLLFGDPADELVALAEREQADIGANIPYHVAEADVVGRPLKQRWVGALQAGQPQLEQGARRDEQCVAAIARRHSALENHPTAAAFGERS